MASASGASTKGSVFAVAVAAARPMPVTLAVTGVSAMMLTALIAPVLSVEKPVRMSACVDATPVHWGGSSNVDQLCCPSSR